MVGLKENGKLPFKNLRVRGCDKLYVVVIRQNSITFDAIFFVSEIPRNGRGDYDVCTGLFAN